MKNRIKFAQHGGQARVLAVAFHRGLSFVLRIVLALGSMVMLPTQQFGMEQAYAAVLNTGVSPTSMNSSNLPQAQVIHYDKKFVKNLKANTCFVRCTARRELPEQAGNQHRLYMYQTLGANTTQQAEGVIGSGIAVSVLANTSTIGNYADYINLSHLARITAIDPALENCQKELAYRFGQTLSTLVKSTADGASAIDSTVDDLSLAYNVAFTRAVITSATQSLAGRNVQPFDNGRFCGVIHPFTVGDALNDTANNSIVDILKRTVEGQGKLSELPAPDGDEVQVLEWGGVSFYQSTMVTQTANYQGQAGKTALRTYIFGEDGVISISLGKKEASQIGNGDWRNLKLWMMKFDEPDRSDPSRVIGGLTSYNAYFTVTLPPDLTMRLRVIDSVSAIS